MELMTCVQRLVKAVCISLHNDALEKGINTYVISSAMGKY